jgi:hypothetical protein
MSSSKNKPREPKITYDWTDQIRRNNPSYKYDVKSIILKTMEKKKVKKKNEGGPILTGPTVIVDPRDLRDEKRSNVSKAKNPIKIRKSGLLVTPKLAKRGY